MAKYMSKINKIVISLAVASSAFLTVGVMAASAASDSSCGLSGGANITVVNLGGPNHWMQSNGNNSYSQPPVGVNLAAGTYKVKLVAYDTHDESKACYQAGNCPITNWQQPYEIFKVKLLNSSGGTIATSNSTQDLGDNTNKQTYTVNTNLVVPSSVAKVQAVHGSNSTVTANSLSAICASFELISAPNNPPTVDIKANGSDNPAPIAYNTSANLTWTSTNATSCSSSWDGPKPINNTSGESTGNLTNTTSYTITCYNSIGQSDSDSVTVTVNQQPQPPTVTINANPNPVNSGATTNLTWNSQNTTSCSTSGGPWVNPGARNINGTEPSAALFSAQTFTITCQNSAGQQASAFVTVNVNQVNLPTVTLTANPSSINSGSTSNLVWTVANATSCTATGNGFTGNKNPAGGNQNTPTLFQTTTYTITCSNSVGQSATDSATVTVLSPQAPTVDLKVNGSNGPITIQSGNSATLDWTSANATSCSASVDWQGNKQIPNGSETTGVLTTARAYNYHIDCFNSTSGLSVHDFVTVVVNPTVNQPTVNLTVNGQSAITINAGTSAMLSWTSQFATSCTASVDWQGNKATSGNISTGILNSVRTYTYNIDCSGAGGNASDSVTVNVVPGQGNLPTVDLLVNSSNGPITINYNSSASLSWVASNANSCVASGSWSGNKNLSGVQGTGNLTDSSYTYDITCGNQFGSDTDSVIVNVNSQVINQPTVDIKANNSNGPISISYNNSAMLSWSSTNADTCVASDNWSGNKSLSGLQSTGQMTTTRTYTITCSNQFGSDSDSVTVNVQGQQFGTPAVDILANGSNGPITINSGTSASLSWVASNVDTCIASGNWNGNRNNFSGIASTGTLTGPASFTYTITCTGPGGNATDFVVVNVNEPQLNAPTVDIKANNSNGPITISSNSSANLTWTSSNADTCSASGSWSGSKNTNGSQSTNSLSQGTYTYTITCSGTGGTASDSVTVNVNQNQVNTPSVDLLINASNGPITINYGQSASLSWVASNADACFASGGWSGTKNLSGTQSTGALFGTQTYTITCTGAGGSASDNVTVNVNGQNNQYPTVTINANPNPVNSGNSSTLTWNSTNASSCYASQGPWNGSKNISGSESTNALFQSTTFGITCQSSSGQTATANVTVDVTNNNYNNPPTLNLYANPSQVPVGSSSTLYWNTTNVTSCTASGDWYGTKVISGTELVGPINVVKNYILTCYGPGGSVVRNVSVSPIGQVLGAAAPTLSIYAIPSPVQYGSGSTLYWNSTNVDYCYASNDWYGSKTISGSQPTGALYRDMTYTITCSGLGGTITRSAVVPVIGRPVVYYPPVVAGVTGSYGATIEKQVVNLSTPNGSGTNIGAWSGNNLEYRVTVRNTGTLTLTNLTIKDVLSDKVEIVKASDAGTYDYVTRTVSWKISRLAAGESKTFTLEVRVGGCDADIAVQNYATLSGSQISSQTSNTVVAGVYAGPFVLSIDNPAPVIRPGDKVTYPIRYRNDSTGTVKGATLDMSLPAAMVVAGGNVTRLTLGDIAPGASGQVQIVATVDKSVLDGEQLTTTARATYIDNGVTRTADASTVSTVSGNAPVVKDNSGIVSSATSSGLHLLPQTFLGWLLLLLLIIILAVFIKRLLSKDEDKPAAH